MTSVYFDKLNEAITEELTRRFIISQKYSLLENDSEELHEIRTRFRDKPNDDNDGRTMLGNETYQARVVSRSEQGQAQINYAQFTYYPERQLLFKLVKQIYEANESKFRDEEEVFQIFAKAAFTGHMLEIAHLVEDTFGKGKFRELGEYTAR